MASSLEFVEYVCGQLAGAGEIQSKKMFGEFGVYLDGKIVGLVCDDQFFVKQSDKGRAVIEERFGMAEMGEPYKGAKPCFLIEELDDREFLAKLLRESYAELPMQKSRKKK